MQKWAELAIRYGLVRAGKWSIEALRQQDRRSKDGSGENATRIQTTEE